MFIPECSKLVKENVVCISGDKYSEDFKNSIKISVTPRIAKINSVLKTIQSSMIEILWESKTIKELEEFFIDKIEEVNVENFRLEESKEGLYGWVHFKNESKIETVRFLISYDGGFKSC